MPFISAYLVYCCLAFTPQRPLVPGHAGAMMSFRADTISLRSRAHAVSADARAFCVRVEIMATALYADDCDTPSLSYARPAARARPSAITTLEAPRR